MDGLSWSMVSAAAGIALIHTVLGPDHYLPFIMLSRARRWSPARTATITTACGAGHVLGSLVLGSLGLALGLGLARLDVWNSARGSLTAWALVAFGAAYGVWGVRVALRRSRGLEPHVHHGHAHVHRRGDRPHDHRIDEVRGDAAPFWTLFAIFVLGPCEPLIPLFVLPASRGRWGLALLCAAVFALVTIASMVGMTLLGAAGLRQFLLRPLERWAHALAGAVIAVSGLAVIFLKL